MAKQGKSSEKLCTATFILLTLVQTINLLVFHTITPDIAKLATVA